MSSNGMLQKLGARLVEREVVYCVSSLVSSLIAQADGGPNALLDDEQLFAITRRQPDASDFNEAADPAIRMTPNSDESGTFWLWEEIDGEGDGIEYDDQLEAWRAAFDATGQEYPDGSEVYEHWIVSNWLADKLEERGEAVARDVAGLTTWGRCTTGQSMALDSVIQDIALDTYGEPVAEIPAYAAEAFLRRVAGFAPTEGPSRLALTEEAQAIIASATIA
jgi:hypothetical protein